MNNVCEGKVRGLKGIYWAHQQLRTSALKTLFVLYPTFCQDFILTLIDTDISEADLEIRVLYFHILKLTEYFRNQYHSC